MLAYGPDLTMAHNSVPSTADKRLSWLHDYLGVVEVGTSLKPSSCADWISLTAVDGDSLLVCDVCSCTYCPFVPVCLYTQGAMRMMAVHSSTVWPKFPASHTQSPIDAHAVECKVDHGGFRYDE